MIQVPRRNGDLRKTQLGQTFQVLPEIVLLAFDKAKGVLGTSPLITVNLTSGKFGQYETL